MPTFPDYLILLRHRTTGLVEDRTDDTSAVPCDGRLRVTFSNGKEYTYGPQKAAFAQRISTRAITEGCTVVVSGSVWENVTDLSCYASPLGEYVRVHYITEHGPRHALRPAREVQVCNDPTSNPHAATVFKYIQTVASSIADGEDHLADALQRLHPIHPDSALARYLCGTPTATLPHAPTAIFPFESNATQSVAIDRALTHTASIIEGPPGTGKTQAILNIIASIVSHGQNTVGLVSFTNSAVDNVLEKLTQQGLHFIAANVGRRDKREVFFAGQDKLSQAREAHLSTPAPRAFDREAFTRLERALPPLRDLDRRRACLRRDLANHRLELAHYDAHLPSPIREALASEATSEGKSHRVLRYLADLETMSEDPGPLETLALRIKRIFLYRTLPHTDPNQPADLGRLERTYYTRRIAELVSEIEGIDRVLVQARYAELSTEHRRLSRVWLDLSLRDRYLGVERVVHDSSTYRRSAQEFTRFCTDYPLLLSTCHSLGSCIPRGHLLDYLIIDESSQVSLPVAVAALAHARNVIVVGDRQQLPPVRAVSKGVTLPIAPHPAYDFMSHSILTSLPAVDPTVPRTLLEEHYRCAPSIIEFCNRSFYDGQLIPFTATGELQSDALQLRLTAEGEHMRRPRSGGGINQREIDVIREEVIPTDCVGVRSDEIGIVTPYKKQVDRITDQLNAELGQGMDTSTVHKFQGRERRVMILTTVLDDSETGHRGVSFADDPQLINVAVSRAREKLILVTNPSLLPKTSNIRNLIDYIHYNNPGATTLSPIVSVFDLMWKSYAKELQRFAGRKQGVGDSPAEDIIAEVLATIVAEEPYRHIDVAPQYRLRYLVAPQGHHTNRERSFLRHWRTSVDFAIYSRIHQRCILAIEVDGYHYHEDNPEQLERDAIKDRLLEAQGIPCLRLSTVDANEESRIRDAIDSALYGQ